MKISIVWMMSSIIEIEKGLYSSSDFVKNQSKKVAKNMKNYLITANSNQKMSGLSTQELQTNLEDIEDAMRRNHDNPQHQRLLREILTNTQNEINNRKNKSKNEPS
jgi:hypothetical protein